MKLSRGVDYTLLAMLAGFTLQWVNIGPVPVAQAFFLLPPVTWYMNRGRLPIGKDVVLLKVYATYTAMLAVGIVASQDIGEGASSVLRSIAYGALAYLFYAYLRTLPVERCLKTLRVAVFYVFPAFALFYMISANLAGVNLLKSLQQAAMTGNPNLIQFQMFQVVLNNGVLDEDKLSSAARHGIMISLMTAAHLHMLMRTEKSRAGTLVCAFIYFLVFFSLSRSSILGLFLGVACIVVKQISAHQFRYARYLLLAMAVAVIVPTSGVFSGGGVSVILEEKFVGDIVDNPRVYEYSRVFDKIGEKVLFGWGTGTPQDIEGLKAQYPHNFLTYSWHQIGFLGFLVALSFLLLVVSYIVLGVVRSTRYARIDPQRSGMYMVSSTLLSIVLVRLLFAKAGLLAIPEWVALSLSLYCFRVAQIGHWDRALEGVSDVENDGNDLVTT
ncbi:O-antigen ligase family protein [Salipiger thiooxidans]|uniref:O-antigen ligase family protein n=1 Tax=Salipiger thiooxidans TaxID=282683 RepID=UPI001CD56D0E|nr:O-antigen ligase family protein [Salipiger thiooxidans]MCA0849969.1 O-antigen ligase family protein [Salipiger thiooxidans]